MADQPKTHEQKDEERRAKRIVTSRPTVKLNENDPNPVEVAWTYDFNDCNFFDLMGLAIKQLNVMAASRYRSPKNDPKDFHVRTWNVKTDFLEKARGPAKSKTVKVAEIAKGASAAELQKMQEQLAAQLAALQGDGEDAS